MGGTFNPIHNGHLLLAEWAMDDQGLDEVWFIPTGCSYLKANQNMPSGKIRYEMVSEAINGHPGMKCLDIEIRRSGNTYTCDTLSELRATYPDYHFYFIFGADCLFSIENWKSPQQIFANCTIIAAIRGSVSSLEMEKQKEYLKEKYDADIKLLSFLQIDISSTLIRERIANGQSVRYLVPDPVIAYIEKKGITDYEKV